MIERNTMFNDHTHDSDSAILASFTERMSERREDGRPFYLWRETSDDIPLPANEQKSLDDLIHRLKTTASLQRILSSDKKAYITIPIYEKSSIVACRFRRYCIEERGFNCRLTTVGTDIPALLICHPGVQKTPAPVETPVSTKTPKLVDTLRKRLLAAYIERAMKAIDESIIDREVTIKLSIVKGDGITNAFMAHWQKEGLLCKKGPKTEPHLVDITIMW